MSDYPVISRVEWGATKVTSKAYQKVDWPIFTIFVSLKSGLPDCQNKEECFKVLKDAQDAAITKDKLDDIPYSFVISKDGSIYEGRGWDIKPQKAIQMEAVDFEPKAYDITFFGDYSPKDVELPMGPFKSMIGLLEMGIKKKYVYQDYDLEPFRGDTFVPVFRPGKDKFKDKKPIKMTELQPTQPYKKPRTQTKQSVHNMSFKF